MSQTVAQHIQPCMSRLMQADAQTPTKAQQPNGYQQLALEPTDEQDDEESAASIREPLMDTDSVLTAQDDEGPPSPFMRLQ